MIRNYNASDDRRSTLTKTTLDRLTGFSPGSLADSLPDSLPDSGRAAQVISTNAARVIETTRHAWLGNATPQLGDTAKQARRPRFQRRPMIANLTLVMNFWSTRPL
jgi:hypothetical protein